MSNLLNYCTIKGRVSTLPQMLPSFTILTNIKLNILSTVSYNMNNVELAKQNQGLTGDIMGKWFDEQIQEKDH